MYNLHYLFRCLLETYYFVKYFCNFCFLATKITYFLASTYYAIIFQTFLSIQDPLLEFAQLCGAENEILCLRYHPYQDQVTFSFKS
jgi:hypothetical protein